MSLRLDPLTGMSPPDPAATESDVRMADIQLAFDVCQETNRGHRGARRRVAEKHRVRPSTVTECMHRVDRALGTSLIARGEHHAHALTPAGDAFVEAAPMILRGYQVLRRHVQRATDGI